MCMFGSVLHCQELCRKEGALLLAAVLGESSKPSELPCKRAALYDSFCEAFEGWSLWAL